MRALLSAVGTRGDVQPLFALATRVRALGHDVRVCVPPNFVAWASALGLDAVAVGVEMRAPVRGAPPLTADEIRRLRESMPDLITNQFDVVGAAADGCDVILGANAHQYAARSVAERRGVPYVTALYAPVAIPSPEHAPPPAPGETWSAGDAETNARRWADNARAWNDRALERVNANRARLGLSPIDDVLSFNVTDRPWLAADAALAPAPSGPVVQTGAWILEDEAPLPAPVTDFLSSGAPPIYFGFGSMPAPKDAGRTLVAAARAIERRAILARGWAELEADDSLAIDDVNQQALFPRVAAVVHHGGAGTTAAAARAGVPQVVVPLFSDQFYWASRVSAVGLGASATLDVESLSAALRRALDPAVAERAGRFAGELDSGGASRAAEGLARLAARA